MPKYRVKLTFMLPVTVDETVEAPDEASANKRALAAAQKSASHSDPILKVKWNNLDQTDVECVDGSEEQTGYADEGE